MRTGRSGVACGCHWGPTAWPGCRRHRNPDREMAARLNGLENDPSSGHNCRVMTRTIVVALACALTSLAAFSAEPATSPNNSTNHPLEFIDTSFENASPLWYDFAPDGTVLVHLLYDHERSSPNRAAGHIHFQLHAKPGSRLTLEFTNLDNVWNGASGSVARELKTVVISENGRDWKPLPLESLPENRVRLHVEMPGPRLYVARVEPYRLSDLDKFLANLRTNRLVEINIIGRTVQGRELEIIRVG